MRVDEVHLIRPVHLQQEGEEAEKEHTPKLSSHDQNHDDSELKEDITTEKLFDEDANEEEDFEIPAFLRRQKF